jgi:glutathione S-transferase
MARMDLYLLYGRTQTGVMAIEAALDEAKLPYRFISLAKPLTDADTAAFARINPRVQVPILIHPDGTIVTEGPAILHHIADASPQAHLIPPPGSSARARHDRWLAFFHANVYEGMLRELYPARYTDDPASAPALQSAATGYVRQHFQIFEAVKDSGPYLLGDAFTVFDIYLWMLCYWIDKDWLTLNCPRIARLWTTAAARPALARVAERHFT